MVAVILCDRFQARNVFPLVVAVGLAVIFWGSFTLTRSIETSRLRHACYGSEIAIEDYCDARYLRQRDPYCIADPTCLSPNFNRAALGYGKGLAIIGDPALIDGNPLRLLALWNLCLFITVVLSCLLLGCAMLQRRIWRQCLFAFVTTVYLLEAARWSEASWRLSLATVGSLNFYFDPETYIMLVGLVLPLGLVYVVLRPALLDKATYGSASPREAGSGRSQPR